MHVYTPASCMIPCFVIFQHGGWVEILNLSVLISRSSDLTFGAGGGGGGFGFKCAPRTLNCVLF